MSEKTHLAKALHWSADTQVHPGDMLAAAFGMAVPLLLAGAMGHLSLGLAAALGSLAIGAGARGEPAHDAGSHALDLAAQLAPLAAAASVASMVAGHGALTDAIVILLAGTAAIISGYSRPVAVATTRFVLLLIMAAGVAGNAPHRAGFLLLTLAGALWTCLLLMLAGPWARARRQPGAPMEQAAPVPAATAAQRFRRWKRTLATLSGWQYTARLVFALGGASLLRWLFPGHHFEWTALTVAILIQRQPEVFSIKTTQRVAGTVLGVLGAALLLGYRLPLWVVAINAGWLAGLRPLLRARNYLAYSVVMTPLMVLIMEASRPADGAMLEDRVAATVIGACLVLLADRMPGWLVQPSA
ncbi:FUSC family protein [Cupriavidus basilensis]|uniref:FUSC family protein n=1 Tax=Cupriavidus basilensis TaxID=68895 RepID=A0ABT6AQU8_9BURK|nr:FUSC family protein [Cupriavidus basilensis]MDF3834962.1 FUSC family protein [Cupriavidus basilensis]